MPSTNKPYRLCVMNLKQKKEDVLWLEAMPFAINFFAIVFTLLDFIGRHSGIHNFLVTFCFLYSVYLWRRSVINNMCFWHRVPIINMLLLLVFHLINYISVKHFNHNFLADPNYILLMALYVGWVSLFLIASVFFLRDRIKKQVRRCCK